MSAQLSYSIYHSPAMMGMLAGQDPHDIASYVTVTDTPYGWPVSFEAGKETVKPGVLPTFAGVAVRSVNREYNSKPSAPNLPSPMASYANGDVCSILRQGSIWVVSQEGCVPNDPVKFKDKDAIFYTGVAGAAGEYNVTGGFWATTAAAGELAVLVLQTVNLEPFT